MSPLAHELDTSPARSRRTLLGAVGSGLTFTASGLLLPEPLAAAPEEVGLPVRHEQRARKRRHRRKKHRHKHDAQAYATAVLSGSQVIPGNTLTTVGFDIVLTVRDFSFDGGASQFVVRETGTYTVDLFLVLSSSSAGRWETRLTVTRPGHPSSDLVYNVLLTTEPAPSVFSTNLRLEKGGTLQVVGEQNSAAEALVSAGAIVITRVG